MPHVSRKKLKKKVFKNIQSQFVSMVAGARSSSEAAKLVKELLTETERVMLAKRLAILLMLKKGYSFREIEKALKVTPQTIVRFWKLSRKKSFHTTARNIAASTAKKDFWKDIEELLRMGMPPRGRGRWNTIHYLMNKNRK